jgi:hypothetical protein
MKVYYLNPENTVPNQGLTLGALFRLDKAC